MNFHRNVDGNCLAIPHPWLESELTSRINGLLIETMAKGSDDADIAQHACCVHLSADEDRSADAMSSGIVALSSLDRIQHSWCLRGGSLNGLLDQLAAVNRVFRVCVGQAPIRHPPRRAHRG